MKLKTYAALLIFAVCSYLFGALNLPAIASERQPFVYTLNVDDTVTAGTAKHIQRGVQLAEQERADALVILLDTPGGLVTATLDIIRDMSASRIPVITYVSPQGAIAASAGTFILLNGHVAAMSPGTTCGAAMPVTMTGAGDAPTAADDKTINFLAGHMKSIARERGRPAELAEKFVTENLTLNNQEALDAGVIDLVAANLDVLLERVDGMTVQTQAGSVRLETAGAKVTALPMVFNEEFIHLISNPTFAMILLMLGIYGLIIGFYSPGFFLPEILGAISLILGLAGMGLFQGNLAAVLLIILGVGLLIAEFFTPTYGVLGTGGVVSMVLGIMFFPAEPLMPAGWFAAFRGLAVAAGVVGAAFLFIVIIGVSRLRRTKPVHGESEYKDEEVFVVVELNPRGQVKIKGEIWQAAAKDGHTIKEGEEVKVLERKGMTLIVESVRAGKPDNK